MMGVMSTTRTTRHIDASPAAVYAALLDPASIAAWRVPAGMTSEVHEFEPRVGGSFRVSLTYDAARAVGKTASRTDTYHGYFAALVPGERVVEVIEFETDDPALAGEMTMTTTIAAAGRGVQVAVLHEGLPAGVSAEDNETGTRMALDNLAALLGSP
jgi:uncharacterized protein YndB with AHSA1/START domain